MVEDEADVARGPQYRGHKLTRNSGAQAGAVDDRSSSL
jgi:hypothetical protein